MNLSQKLFKYIFCLLSITITSTGTAENLDSAFAVARQLRKPILVYFHYDGCGACRRMEKESLNDSTTKKIIAENYIFISVNTLKGNGPEIRKQYNIVAQPAFLFIDPDKNVYHKLVGYFDKQKFESTLQHEGLIQNPGSLLLQKQKYNEGCRDSAFLIQYIYALKDASELNENVVKDYYNSGIAYSGMDAMELFYEVSYHKGGSYIKFSSPYFAYVLSNKGLFYQKYDTTQIDIRIIFTCFDAINQAKQNNDVRLFESSISVLKLYDNKGTMDLHHSDGEGNSAMVMTKNMTTYARVDFYKDRDKNLFKKYSAEKKELIWNDVEELDNISWLVANYSNDTSRYEESLLYAKRSIELSPNETNYYTAALLYYKLGDMNKAKRACMRSIAYDKKKGEKYDRQTKLLAKIETAAKE